MQIVQHRRLFFLISLMIILAGFIAMGMHASAGQGMLNLDTDFTGGTAIQVDIGEDFVNHEVEKLVQNITGQNSMQVQRILDSNEVSIKLASLDSAMRTTLSDAFLERFPKSEVLSISDVSATVSQEMQQTAIKATLLACGAMLVYISIRFRDMRAGCSAIAALLYDALVVVAAYALFRIPVSNTFIAVLLTIVGYSINSTIIIFDRIRENAPLFRPDQTIDKINKSIVQTLGRSVNTTLTTLFTVGAVYLLGVQSLKEFALPLMIGIVSGAYSSICLSGSFWYMMLPKDAKGL